MSALYNQTTRDYFVTKTDLSLGAIKTKLYIGKYDLEKYIIPRPDVGKKDGLDTVTFYMSFAKEESYGYRWFSGQSDRLKSPLYDLATRRAIEPEEQKSTNSYLNLPRVYVLANSEASRLNRTDSKYDKIFTLAEVQSFFGRQRVVDIDLRDLRFSLLLTNPAIPRILTVTFDMMFPESRDYTPDLVIEVDNAHPVILVIIVQELQFPCLFSSRLLLRLLDMGALARVRGLQQDVQLERTGSLDILRR